MKVLITHELFPPDFAGGGEYVVLEMARGLMRAGVQVQVLTTGDPSLTEFDGIPTVRLPISRYRMNVAVREIAKLARNTDLIQTCFYHASLPSFLAGKITGKPVVCFVTSLFQDTWKTMRPRVIGGAWSAWERLLLRRPYCRTVFPSEFARDLGVSLGVPADRAVVNCPGVDLDSYSPSPRKDDVVFFTGKLDVRKGVYSLIEVARALPQVRFKMMGWGPNAARVKESAPHNIQFVPFARGEPLRDAFAKARIFFFPSLGETFGLAVVEAMASGCAIISSVPLHYEGVRISPKDTPTMIRAVNSLWNSPLQTERMGARNVELARQYTWSRFTSIMLQTYSEALSCNCWAHS